MTRERRRYSAKFTVKTVFAVLKGDKATAQLAGEPEVRPIVLSESKQQFLPSPQEVFDKGRQRSKNPEEEKAALFEEIGRLKMELEWLKKINPTIWLRKGFYLRRPTKSFRLFVNANYWGYTGQGYYQPKPLFRELSMEQEDYALPLKGAYCQPQENAEVHAGNGMVVPFVKRENVIF